MCGQRRVDSKLFIRGADSCSLSPSQKLHRAWPGPSQARRPISRVWPCHLAFTPEKGTLPERRSILQEAPGGRTMGHQKVSVFLHLRLMHVEERTEKHFSCGKQPRPICTQRLGCNLFIVLCLLETKISTALVQIKLQSACQRRPLKASVFGKKCQLRTLNFNAGGSVGGGGGCASPASAPQGRQLKWVWRLLGQKLLTFGNLTPSLTLCYSGAKSC